MIASSILNSICFKRLMVAPDLYPNAWNTLHNDRKQGNFKIIPYYQKYPNDHVIYLQFESDIPTAITLKSFCGNAELESITADYVSSYGTTYARYYTNFTITLDADYHNKAVWFTATQDTDVLTSEPIQILELTDKIERGIMKYIKYTNYDRISSDLDDRFIDWSALTNTGRFMDMFIEGMDKKPNDTDKSEILEGSQSQTIISASFYSGKQFETGGIPDYLASKLAMISSLDMFMVNGIQYIKNGDATQTEFGSSTLYQVSMKLTQKNAAGINVDNLSVAGDIVIPVVPPVVTPPTVYYPMYIGNILILSGSFTPTELVIKSLEERTDYKSNQDFTFTYEIGRYCFAYPTSYGSLISILNNENFETISGFQVNTLDFTFDGVTVNYTVYTLIRTVIATSPKTIKFKFS